MITIIVKKLSQLHIKQEIKCHSKIRKIPLQFCEYQSTSDVLVAQRKEAVELNHLENKRNKLCASTHRKTILSPMIEAG